MEWLLNRYTPVPFPSGYGLMAVDEAWVPPVRQETTLSGNNQALRYGSKVDYVLGRLLRHKGCDVRNFQLKKYDNGKPYGLMEGRRMGVGIAHCRSLLVCALNIKGETGIDVEPCKRSMHPRLRNRISHPGEHLALPADLCSIRLWTIKEAVLKFLGTGLRLAMNKIRLDMLDDHLFRAELESGIFTVTSFSFREHWIAVVFDGCNLQEAPPSKT